MKNKYYLILVVLVVWACSPDPFIDCFSQDGSTEIRFFEVDAFEKIIIRKDIELRITYAEMQRLSVEARANIINGIELNLTDNELEIVGKELCPSGSENAPYIVHLETPNLKEIRNSSQYKVISENTLVFDTLRLDSENYNDETALANGDFELDLDLEQLIIVHAGLSDFTLTGHTNRFNLGFYSGSGRILAQGLQANQIGIYHRGFGDVHVFPLNLISGELRSTGNLILYNQPTTENLETFFTGEILYNID
jgi:hypothetical protein